jgi:uncharacterized protein
MKKVINLLFALFLCIGAALMPQKILAETETTAYSNVVDNADILNDAEEKELLDKMAEISDRQSCDIVVVTMMSSALGSQSIESAADDLLNSNYGKGSDNSGILLLVSMKGNGHGDYWISTKGYGITALTDAGIDYIKESFVPYLKEQEYIQAFEDFADNCDVFLTEAKTDSPYDSGHMPRGTFPLVRNLLIAVVAGFIIAFIIVSVMKSKLKSVQMQKSASNYVKNGSMHITEQKDLFLYRNVTRTEKPKENSGGGSSTHSSSSGSRNGGGGGSF